MFTSRALLLSLVLAPGVLAAQAPASNPSVAQFEPKEWEVPYGANTRPRDPFPDKQGRVWFVGQNGNYIAYVDSKTGEFKRYEIDAGNSAVIVTTKSINNTHSVMATPHPAPLLARVAPKCSPFARNQSP